jgi:L-ascorbate metabolism protein UlaG (beta-lactamase superfamily)
MKRPVLAFLVLIGLITSFAACRNLAYPSFESFKALEVRSTPRQGTSLRATFMGVTTILLDDGETAIMTDGYFSRPDLTTLILGKIEPDQARITHALNRAGVTKLAAVLTAHSHHDHAMDSPEVARRTKALLIGSESTANIAQGQNFPEDRIRLISGGETFTFGRFRITVIKSPHSPCGLFMGDITKLVHPPAKVWAYKEGGNYSFLIEHDEARILIHPSANYDPGFLNNVRADVVFLGIGILGKQSDQFARDYWREVVHATGARVVIPVHWDDFTRPLDEPLHPMPPLLDDVDRAMKIVLQLAEVDHVAVRFMPAFESVEVSQLSR